MGWGGVCVGWSLLENDLLYDGKVLIYWGDYEEHERP
jgi:hypothetical protein